MNAAEARSKAIAAQSRDSYDFKKIMELIELHVAKRMLVYNIKAKDDQTHKGIINELQMLGYKVSYLPSNEIEIIW